MAGVLPHNKAFLNFTNETGQVASIGLAVSSPSPITSQAALSTWATASAAWIVSNIGTSLTGLMDASTSIVSVKMAYMVGTRQVAAATSLLSTAKVGTGTTPLPGQVSCVFSLLSALTGKSYRGRSYWPATGAAIGASGRFTAVLATLATQFDLLIKGAISGAAGAPGAAAMAIYSATHDVCTSISNIRVGDVPDIQRRRRQKGEVTATIPY